MRFSKNGHKNRLLSVPAAIAVIVLFTASCQAKSGQSEDPDKPNPQLKTVTLRSGDVQVIAEVALTELERNRGLMFRKNLAEGKGMLFVFETDEKVAFWMKNTSIPLSLAYLGSDGTILQILDLVPFSQDPRLSERSVRYALEVPQGWFAEVGLEAGDRFEIPPLK